MKAVLDTNVVVRHFTGDPPDQAAAATRYVREAQELILTHVIAAEFVYVLERLYKRPQAEVARLLRSVLGLRNVTTSDVDLLLRALDLYALHRLAFADSYIAAQAERSGVDSVASFDRGIDRVTTVERVEPS